MRHHLLHATQYKWIALTLLVFLTLSGTAIAGTPIENDPKGFFDITWGTPLANQHKLRKIDTSDTLKIFTLKEGIPHVDGIPMESVKLYDLENQYARAIFRYKGESTHNALIQYLEENFGKIDRTYATMTRGLNQQYSWRGPETEISITYHGFRERGFLTAESRIFAPLFLSIHGDQSF